VGSATKIEGESPWFCLNLWLRSGLKS
jgi:hypothetical protein